MPKIANAIGEALGQNVIVKVNAQAEPKIVEEPFVQAINQPSSKPVNTTRIIEVVYNISEQGQANRELGRRLASENDWIDTQWICLDKLWGIYESGWRNTAQNPRSTAYGIAQFLDSTWAGTGIIKTSDPKLQIQAGFIYIENRFGTPCQALKFRLAKGWY